MTPQHPNEDILHRIIARKHIELKRQKEAVSLHTMLAMGDERIERPIYSLRKALAASPTGIIAEFKRRSPSGRHIAQGALVADVIPAYQKAGAAACSILTDESFFGGSLGDLRSARRLTTLPLLRKDFIIDPYQVYQARIMGADAILLIASALTPGDCASLASTAHSLGMETMLEVHTPDEMLAYLTSHIDILGVNNRNLGTFDTDTTNSLRLSRHIGVADHSMLILVSESGISDPATIMRLRAAGFRGFLIGTALMKEAQPGDALAKLIGGLG
ncbi:MAG: indole-3-glycerol phosphate synthase TrpC [Tannerellaceae bacterium]|jgi:indole-3-glycerol phosphate synthase|nr:indole-3-glycerol phosphate synthase TrpC [Tannerellaceae bacterium]